MQRLPAAGYRGLPTVLHSRYLLSIGYFDYVARGRGVVVEGAGFKNMLDFVFCQFKSASVPTCFRLYQRGMINRLLCNLTPNKHRCHGIKHGERANGGQRSVPPRGRVKTARKLRLARVSLAYYINPRNRVLQRNINETKCMFGLMVSCCAVVCPNRGYIAYKRVNSKPRFPAFLPPFPSPPF